MNDHEYALKTKEIREIFNHGIKIKDAVKFKYKLLNVFLKILILPIVVLIFIMLRESPWLLAISYCFLGVGFIYAITMTHIMSFDEGRGFGKSWGYVLEAFFVDIESYKQDGSHFDNLIKSIQRIYKMVIQLTKLYKKGDTILAPEGYISLKRGLDLAFSIIFFHLGEIKSILEKKIESQKTILKDAQDSLEKNLLIKQSGSLGAQKIRLDRQIEQFEELQGVLMKL